METQFKRTRLLVKEQILLIYPLHCGEEDILDSMGPDGGSVVAMAMDPNDSDILYAGTWGGGMYKSLNGG